MDPTLRFRAHPTENTLEAYALNRLSANQVADIETHLLVCEACQSKVVELDDYTRSMRAVLREAPAVKTDVVRQNPFGRWAAPWAGVALAATALLAIGIYVWLPNAPGTPVKVELSALRGIETGAAPAPAGVPLDLQIKTTRVDGRTGFRIEVVTSVGAPAWDGPLQNTAEGRPNVRIEKGLSAGSYWVRLYDPANQLLQEYGLHLR